MDTKYFVVELIDGDYAHLRNTEKPEDEPMLVARALLPEEIREGSKIKLENFQFELAD